MVQTFVKRPTSPLHFEPLQARPEDVLWPGSDDEADEDEREKKRVRVETLGKQYLEGRPLFIQSAGLVGPFDRGWQNPWVKRRRTGGVIVKRSSEALRVADKTVYGQVEPYVVPTTVKRRSTADSEVNSAWGKAASEEVWEEPKAKRRRHDHLTKPLELSTAGGRPTSANGTRDDPRNDWLKRDEGYMHSRSRERRAPPSPTPMVRPRSKPLGTSPVHKIPPAMAAGLRISSEVEERRSPNSVSKSGVTPLNDSPALRRNQNLQSSHSLSQPIRKGPISPQAMESPKTRMGQIGLHNPEGGREPADGEAKQLSQEAPMSPIALKDRTFEIEKPSTNPASRAFPDTGRPMPSRLSPYVSHIVQYEAATSASFKVKAKSKSPKPSFHAAPPSTYMPEFQYHYAKREPISSFPKWKLRPSGTTREQHERPRSMSNSSSGSSDFAEAFEAAQAKAASGSLRSSHTSSPVVERPESRSMKKNTQEMRRLTFTSSGEPKIAGARKSSRPSSSSSAFAVSVATERSKETTSENAKEGASIHKTSMKSSDRPLMNDNRPRNSDVLPEAQIVPKAPIQVPSGPSTDLMETDKQSPKFVSLEEEDSYFDLSTQAAMLKAQRAFKDDVLSPIKTSPGHFREGKFDPYNSRPDRATATPKINGHVNRAAGRSIVKREPQDEERMSTQAIADAISPFAVTTVKKRPPALNKRASFAPSPTRDRSPSPVPTPHRDPSPTFQNSLSMATTPSTSQPKLSPKVPRSHPTATSKPPSSLTSFSMLPNGTLTETSFLQDGQEPQQHFDVSLPLDPFCTPSATANGNVNQQQQPESWDINAAIEEAGSFLGDWNVKAEAKKEGSLGKQRDVGPRGMLSFRRES